MFSKIITPKFKDNNLKDFNFHKNKSKDIKKSTNNFNKRLFQNQKTLTKTNC